MRNKEIKEENIKEEECATYENKILFQLSKLYTAGGTVGSKNHSYAFTQKFRPHLYQVLRTTLSKYIVTNNTPFGFLADKMTSKHITRQMIGIRIPVWDIRYVAINKDTYLQCSAVHDLTGKGIAAHLVKTLESFGLNSVYQRSHMAGQYVHLNVDSHSSETF